MRGGRHLADLIVHNRAPSQRTPIDRKGRHPLLRYELENRAASEA